MNFATQEILKVINRSSSDSFFVNIPEINISGDHLDHPGTLNNSIKQSLHDDRVESITMLMSLTIFYSWYICHDNEIMLIEWIICLSFKLVVILVAGQPTGMRPYELNERPKLFRWDRVYGSSFISHLRPNLIFSYQAQMRLQVQNTSHFFNHLLFFSLPNENHIAFTRRVGGR